MEIFIKGQFLNHLNENEILIENQSGFRNQHACESSIQLVISKWKELIDQNKVVVTVFVDFKRAFETINRNLLIRQLECYGIVDKANNWFKNYLSDRYQQTRIGEEISNKAMVKFGVPQGSVLGPLLFITYINDIVQCFEDDTIVNLFVDDTLISVYGDNIIEVLKKMQSELQKLENWLKITICLLIHKKLKSLFLEIGIKY